MTEAVGLLKRLDEFTLTDLEAVALILRGESIIDWYRLNIQTPQEARQFLAAQELLADDALDRERMDHLRREAVSYLRRQFKFPIPKPIELASPEELLLVASGRGHRQMCACSLLKAMHIIHHLDGRELLFMLPLSDQEIFHLVEEKVYRVVGGMLSAGFPITEFVGGRKNKDSLYTKLLSKQGTIAAAIYDKLRFRIVTRTAADILPILLYLSHRLFPFNYVIPGESVNSVFHFKSFCESHAHLRGLLADLQTGMGEDLTPGDNRFSAGTYRTVHFVVDMPIRLPKELLELAPHQARNLGAIVFVLCEFQLVDQDTEEANEVGEASHSRYKQRQKTAVVRRLKIGIRDSVPVAGAHAAASKPAGAKPSKANGSGD